MVSLSIILLLHVLRVQGTGDGDFIGGACTEADEVKEASSFLQLSKVATRGRADFRLEHARQWTRVMPFNCTQYRMPIRLMKEDNGSYAFKGLDVDTGSYHLLFYVPYGGKLGLLDGCGINPVDGIIYCTLKQDGENFVVRLDAQTLEYVAKLPGLDEAFNAGAFSPDGTYFVANEEAEFHVIQNLSIAEGHTLKTSKRLLSLQGEEPRQLEGFQSAADVVAVKKDLEGLGEMEYVFVVNRAALMVARYDDESSNFTKSWVIPYSKDGTEGTWDEEFGTGWRFDGKVFFAQNEGEGVFEVDLDVLNLTKVAMMEESATKRGVFNLTKVGPSEKGAKWNDGLSCPGSTDPWLTKVAKFDCLLHPLPIQARRLEAGYAIEEMDISTGNYTTVYQLPFAMTTPPYQYLNAIGINPMDGIPYGCLLFDPFPNVFYIVRFDDTKVEFVVKILDMLDPVAGAFSSNGTFFFMQSGDANKMGPTLFSMDRFKLHSMKGYLNARDPDILVLSNISAEGLQLKEQFHFSDIAVIKYDLMGTGKEDYVVAANDKMQAVMVKWEGAHGIYSDVYKLKTNDLYSTQNVTRNFGSVWNYNGRVFFSASDGSGVYEAAQVLFDKSEIILRKMGNSTIAFNGDGFNCWSYDSPFKRTDELRNGTVMRSAFKDWAETTPSPLE